MRISALALLALLVVDASAAVYRCPAGAAWVYTDRPCAAGARPHALAPIGSVPAGAATDLLEAHEARGERLREQREAADRAWLESHAERKQKDARADAAVAEGRVLVDMSADQVRRALGSPDQVQRDGGREEWTYGSGKRRRTVVLEDGKVVRGPSRRAN